ncbi:MULTISPECIES: hypothetical protein [Yersinia pseudotuberculosis complex]|uniref:hypothetical protein n=1 Tax=Yersinia pseudotuberculosis complex TaxID=1649845 RepID=UPI0012D47FE2|nr:MULTISPECIES: hypothetical protein [Yersinia pseudotuberculosis complex]
MAAILMLAYVIFGIAGFDTAILLKTQPDILLLALGLFVVFYAIYSLSGLKPAH